MEEMRYFAEFLRHDTPRSNKNGVPIPPTAGQAIEAFRAVRRHYEKRPTLATRVIIGVQMLMQGFHSPEWQDDAIAAGYCRRYLNGF